MPVLWRRDWAARDVSAEGAAASILLTAERRLGRPGECQDDRMTEARINPPLSPVPEHGESAALWRERLGETLRAVRIGRRARLVDVAERAGISPQYLSEIERGRKEPSSEMIAAVVGALGVDLDQVLEAVLERAGRRSRSDSRAEALRRPATGQDGRVAVLRRAVRARPAGRFGGARPSMTTPPMTRTAGPMVMAMAA